MKYVPSSLFSEFAGSIGGVTFSKTRSGLYCKQKGAPGRSVIPANHNIQERFSQIASQWRALSESVKSDWGVKARTYTLYDRFEAPYIPTAYQLFIYKNIIIWPITVAFITTPVNFAVLSDADVAPNALNLTSDEFNIDWGTPALPGEELKFWISHVYAASGWRLYPPVRYAFFIWPSAPNPYNAYGPVNALIGSELIEGRYFTVNYQRVNITTGLTSALGGEGVNIIT